MATMEIALDIGTSYTSIYLSGQGIVLREPSVVAFLGDPKQRRVRAVGNDAMEMLGKTPDKTSIVTPVVDGVIADYDTCVVMLKEYIKKILPDNFVFFPKIKAILGIPMGLSVEERKMYEDACYAARISEITMIENIMLAGVGIDLPVSQPNGGFVVNIGGGVTEIAALSLGGVISGCGVTIGGNMMDKALIDFLSGKLNVKVGINAARRLKKEIGSLAVGDNSQMNVEGIDVRSKSPVSEIVYATDIREALLPYYNRICDAVENMINMCPPAIAGDIYKNGIYVVGGASMIFGLDEVMKERLKLNVYTFESPEYAVILGGGRLLSDRALLSAILEE